MLAAADRRLLGDTISVEDAAWREPSQLPGWSRAHVATHLARHAEAFGRLANWAHTGHPQQMYPGDRNADIDAGAGRSGLEIQTDLDTATGRLAEEFDAVAEAGAWEHSVTLRDGREVRAGQLPAGRLTEVIIHHLDLGIGLSIDEVEPPAAEAALAWCAFRLASRSDFPRLRITTSTGSTYDFGPQHQPEVSSISGPANRLLGWISRRSGPDGLSGQLPELPSFG